MTEERLSQVVDKSWVDFLLPLFQDERMTRIQEKLGQLVSTGRRFFPSKDNVFRVFKDTPLNEVKVIIIGQDPYIRPNQAIGRAFAVPITKPNPPSLKIIVRELYREYNIDERVHFDSTLQSWTNQGVLLLNTALTVEEGKSNSHAKDWLWFTQEVVRKLQDTNSGLIFVQWGKQAQSFSVNEKVHHVLKACHPQAQNYGSGEFIGCGHFEKINEIIEGQNGEEYRIKWV